MNIEWDQVFDIVSPLGTLRLNEATTSPFTSDASYVFLLDRTKCAAAPLPLRTTSDPIPQGDGSIIHPTFKSGYVMRFALEFWVGGDDPIDREPAINTDRRVMWDTLVYYLNSLLNPSVADLFGGNARVHWEPFGYPDDRLLDRLRLVEWPTETDDGIVSTIQFAVASEFPYAVDLTQQVSELDWVAFNGGSSEMFPVFKAYAPGGSPMGSFVIANNTTGFQIQYDSAFPGASLVPAGEFVEIDTFRNTVYLNGNSANYKPGIDMTASTFWSLHPGANDVTFLSDTGGSCQMLWQNAWA